MGLLYWEITVLCPLYHPMLWILELVSDNMNLLVATFSRFVIWTKSAYEKLDDIYGKFDKPSLKKKGYLLPRSKMVNADLARIINSDEVQSVVRPIKKDVNKRATLKKNLLKNLNVFLNLNPYAKTAKRMSLLVEAQHAKAKKEKLDKKRHQITKEEAAAIRSASHLWYKTAKHQEIAQNTTLSCSLANPKYGFHHN